MVYLAELLVVMSDRFKNVTICARNAPCAHGRNFTQVRKMTTPDKRVGAV